MLGRNNIGTERGEVRRDWTLPMPLQETQPITQAASRLPMQMPLTVPVTSLRLRVEEMERPKAAADLFASRIHWDTLALEAARQMLAERYGPQVLVPLSQRPQSVREQRSLKVRDGLPPQVQKAGGFGPPGAGRGLRRAEKPPAYFEPVNAIP